MANTTEMDREPYMMEKLILILLGAVSGILSLSILTGYIQANQWLSPLLGFLAVLLLMSGGLIGSQRNT